MYVVTGASGNTGSVVADRLLAAGKKVRGISRSAGRMQSFAKKGGEPCIAELTDSAALAKAFTGAEGVYVMIPGDPTRSDFRANYDAVTEAIASALERSHVQHVVTLSSVGADKPEKTGPVVGLHRMEERLNRISGIKVLHLRAAYFMENTMMQAAMIQRLNMAVGPLLPELKFPMIATRDIGAAAAEALLHLNFDSRETRELLGPRDITMQEVAAIIGRAIGKPDLKYAQAPDDQIRSGMQQMGMSAEMAGLVLEMSAAMNTGYMKALEPRGARNTTPTTYEKFVHEEFLPHYKGSKAA